MSLPEAMSLMSLAAPANGPAIATYPITYLFFHFCDCWFNMYTCEMTTKTPFTLQMSRENLLGWPFNASYMLESDLACNAKTFRSDINSTNHMSGIIGIKTPPCICLLNFQRHQLKFIPVACPPDMSRYVR